MTVLLDDGSNQPGTHVLLVGVGDYAFLKDGAAPEANRFQHHMDMGQLSSPPRSIEELAKWFCDDQNGFHNPDRPLRSLQILCSAAIPFAWTAPGGSTQPVARATVAAVDQAVNDWKTRCSRNDQNLMIFYFCGHGLAFSETENSLLCDDFGGNAAAPMSKAIAFDAMRLGLMRQCDARYQCYFVDACRTLPTRAFKDTYGDDSVGIPVVQGGLTTKIRDKVGPVYFAAGLASAAYGLKDQPSLFLQGMLGCFRGVGSRDADDHYAIVIDAVAEGINKCVEGLAFQSQPQYCQPRDTGHSFTLHRVRGEPEVMVKVFTRDETLLTKAILSHTSQSTNRRVERQPGAVPWWVPLPLGVYSFEAVSTNGAQLIGQKSKHVSPPAAKVGL